MKIHILKLKYLKIVSTLILGLAIVNLNACKKASQSDADANVLNVGLSDDISTLDPANSYDTVSASVVYQIYETLFEYEYLKRPYTLRPLLADTMPTVENKGTRYIIKIKKNVRYHDHPAFGGKARFLKAQDFITQLKRLAFVPTKSNGWWLFEGKIKGLDAFREQAGTDFNKFKSLTIEGLTAPDDHTLIIDLVESYPQMMYALAMSFSAPVPLEVIEQSENDISRTPVGTGPFEMVTWHEGLSVELKKFPHYREESYPYSGDRIANDNELLKDAGKRLPFLNRVNYQIMKENQTRWLNFNANKIDYLGIPKDNFSSAITSSGTLSPELKSKNVQLQVNPTLTYWWLSFNMRDPLLGKNKNLRLAIAHAVDVNKYIEVFTNNVGQKANSIYPPGIPGYDPTRKLNFSHNLEKAKQYLKEAGFPEGKGLPVFTYDVRGSDTTSRQMGEFIKAELEKIGIQTKISVNTFPAFLKKAKEGNLQFWLDGWALDYPDAENILQLLVSKNHPPGPNTTYYNNPVFDELFQKIKFLPDGSEKFNLMKQMEDIVLNDIPWVMLFYSRTYILYHDHLKNFRHSDLGANYFKYLRVTKK